MKITKTYSIEQNLFELFDIICKRKNINKSSIIEKSINDFISKNNKKFNFQLKEDESIIVNIKEIENDFYILNDGSKYPTKIFHKIFKVVDNDVNMDEFFNNDSLIKIFNKLKNIDTTEPGVSKHNEPVSEIEQVNEENEYNLDNLCITKLKVNANFLTLLDSINIASSKEMRHKMINKLRNMSDNDEILGMVLRLKELNDNDIDSLTIDTRNISNEISKKKEHDKKMKILIDDIKEKIKNNE